MLTFFRQNDQLIAEAGMANRTVVTSGLAASLAAPSSYPVVGRAGERNRPFAAGLPTCRGLGPWPARRLTLQAWTAGAPRARAGRG